MRGFQTLSGLFDPEYVIDWSMVPFGTTEQTLARARTRAVEMTTHENMMAAAFEKNVFAVDPKKVGVQRSLVLEDDSDGGKILVAVQHSTGFKTYWTYQFFSFSEGRYDPMTSTFRAQDLRRWNYELFGIVTNSVISPQCSNSPVTTLRRMFYINELYEQLKLYVQVSNACREKLYVQASKACRVGVGAYI